LARSKVGLTDTCAGIVATSGSVPVQPREVADPTTLKTVLKKLSKQQERDFFKLLVFLN
jgi:hypothetical protein